MKGFEFFSHAVQVWVFIFEDCFKSDGHLKPERWKQNHSRLRIGCFFFLVFRLKPLMQSQIAKSDFEKRGCGQNAWSRSIFKSPVSREQWRGSLYKTHTHTKKRGRFLSSHVHLRYFKGYTKSSIVTLDVSQHLSSSSLVLLSFPSWIIPDLKGADQKGETREDPGRLAEI